jgi:hypothetical protein
MSQRATDKYLEALEVKPRARAANEAAKEAYKLKKKRAAALEKLTGGGFLIPKSSVLKEGLEELRDAGHRKADIIERINRKRKT